MTSNRRIRWGVAALLLMVTGAGGLRAWKARDAEPLQTAASAAALPAASATSAGAAPAVLAQDRRVEPLPQPSAAAPSAPADKTFVEVCGIGRVKRTELERREGEAPPAWWAEWEQQTQRAPLAIVGRLAAGSQRQRVVAALMGDDVQGAAEMAASTPDPTTYLLALRACRADASQRSYRVSQAAQPPVAVASGASMPELPALGPLPTACAALNVDKLQSLDPSSAWPWVARIEDGLASGDHAGVSEALYQLAQRPYNAPPTRAFSAAMAGVVGADPTGPEALALMSVLGRDMANIDFPHTAVSRACRPEALRDANRRQLCERAARRLPDMTRELPEAAVLYLLEERLGMPHSPQAVSKDELRRLQEALSKDSMKWLEEPSCANFADMGRLTMQLARHGELAHARELLRKAPASAPR